MKRSIIIIITALTLGLIPITTQSAEMENPTPAKLITAVDLLKQKNLSPFQPACAVGGPATGLITGEDLLRLKGLSGILAPKSDAKDDQEDDIWGMGQDFGC